eukprot:g19932.t1
MQPRIGIHRAPPKGDGGFGGSQSSFNGGGKGGFGGFGGNNNQPYVPVRTGWASAEQAGQVIGTSCPFYATNGTRLYKCDATPTLATVLKEVDDIGNPRFCPAPLHVEVAEDAMKIVGLLNAAGGMENNERRQLMNEMHQLMRRRMTGVQGVDLAEGGRTVNWIGEVEWSLMREEKTRLAQEQLGGGGEGAAAGGAVTNARIEELRLEKEVAQLRVQELQMRGGQGKGGKEATGAPRRTRSSVHDDVFQVRRDFGGIPNLPKMQTIPKNETYAAHFNMARDDGEDEGKNHDMDASFEVNEDEDAQGQDQWHRDYKNDDPCYLNFQQIREGSGTMLIMDGVTCTEEVAQHTNGKLQATFQGKLAEEVSQEGKRTLWKMFLVRSVLMRAQLAITDDLSTQSTSPYLSDEEWHQMKDNEGSYNAAQIYEELAAELENGVFQTIDDWITDELEMNMMSLEMAEKIAQAAHDFLNLSNPYQLGLSNKHTVNWEELIVTVDNDYGANPFSRSAACKALEGEEGVDGKFLFHPVAELAAAIAIKRGREVVCRNNQGKGSLIGGSGGDENNQQKNDVQGAEMEGVINGSNQTTTVGGAGEEGEEPRPRSMSDGKIASGGNTKGRKLTRASLMRGTAAAANNPTVQKNKDAKKNKTPPCPP